MSISQCDHLLSALMHVLSLLWHYHVYSSPSVVLYV